MIVRIHFGSRSVEGVARVTNIMLGEIHLVTFVSLPFPFLRLALPSGNGRPELHSVGILLFSLFLLNDMKEILIQPTYLQTQSMPLQPCWFAWVFWTAS